MEFLLLALILFAAKDEDDDAMQKAAALFKSEALRGLRIGSRTAGEWIETAERLKTLAERGDWLHALGEGTGSAAMLGGLAQMLGSLTAKPLAAPPALSAAEHGAAEHDAAEHDAAGNPFAPIAPFAPAEFVCALNKFYA